MRRCASCGEENPDRARFCLACGSPLETAASAAEVRRTVSLVFADVTDSTSLGERLDPESLRRVMGRYFEVMSAVLEAHGGRVEKFVGDAIVAAFGVPTVREDDALRAVRAAAGMQAALPALNAELSAGWGVQLSMRVGVNTGEVVLGDPRAGGSFATGDAVNVAARLEQAADPGDVLIGDATYQLVRPQVSVAEVGLVTAKGKADPVASYRLLEVADVVAEVPTVGPAGFVGRERELRLLTDAFERATAERSCQLVTVLGSAGVGKSRLVAEFAARDADRRLVLRGRCLSYGDGVAFWPVREMLRAAVRRPDELDADLAPADGLARLAELVGHGSDADLILARLAPLAGFGGEAGVAEETYSAFRRFADRLARTQPLVLVFEDLHWADGALVDLLDAVVDWSRDAPLLVVVTARPDLLDDRPGWGGGKLNATSALLQPLPPEDRADLVSGLLGGPAPEQLDRLLGAAEGNPLFVQQMVAMLRDDGLLVREGGRWVVTSTIDSVRPPPTIQALLAARLDRLSSGELETLEAAAVEGRVFHESAVREMVGFEGVDAALRQLVRKELVRPDDADLAGDRSYRFLHALVLDAAYEAMSKSVRADHHVRFARWLAGHASVAAGSSDELVGHHLATAAELRAELGPLDPDGRALAVEAAGRLSRAADAAMRSDADLPVSLLHRAYRLLPDGTERLDVLVELLDVVHRTGPAGGWQPFLPLAEDGRRLAGQLGDPLRERLFALFVAGTRSTFRESDPAELPRADALVQELRAAGRYGEAAMAATMRSLLILATGQMDAQVASNEEAVELAGLSGNENLRLSLIRFVAAGIAWTSRPVADVLATCEQWLAETEGAGLFRTQVLATTASSLARLGRCDEAFARVRELEEVLERSTGRPFNPTMHGFHVALVHALCGDARGAADILARAADELGRHGERGWRSSLLAERAWWLLELGEVVEGRGAAEECARIVLADDLMAQAQAGLLAARLALLDGHLDEAVGLADRAIEVADQQTAVIARGQSRLVAAAAARLQGGDADHLTEAVDLFTASGDVVEARNAPGTVERMVAACRSAAPG